MMVRDWLAVGVIADTHGKLPEKVLEALAGVSYILHAGDIGRPQVIRALEDVAPVYAVNGNEDNHKRGGLFPPLREITFLGHKILLVHDLGPTPELAHPAIMEKAARNYIDIIIFGHSHLPTNEVMGKMLFFNPGSPSQPRFGFPPSVGILTLSKNEAFGEIIYLNHT
jgi:hypothetical protein